MGPEGQFAIGYVSRVTGLSAHVIRVWERRYALVEPQRSATNRRLYSQTDIERLRLVKKAVDAGHRISLLVDRDVFGLQALVASGSRLVQSSPQSGAGDQAVDPAPHLNAGLAAVMALDRAGLEQCLRQAAVALPKILLLTRVVAPLLERIGALWADGALRIINEHMATTVIQSLLWDLLHQGLSGPGAPAMVVATPTGQQCELGALMVAVIGADCGWDVHYFGPNLPCPEIAAAVMQKNARAVALSLAFGSDPPWLIRQLDQLIKGLPAGVAAFIGGRGIDGLRGQLETLGFHCPDDLNAFAGAIARQPENAHPF